MRAHQPRPCPPNTVALIKRERATPPLQHSTQPGIYIISTPSFNGLLESLDATERDTMVSCVVALLFDESHAPHALFFLMPTSEVER